MAITHLKHSMVLPSGDYPLPASVNEGVIPAQIVFSIFNDAGGAHTSSLGEALKIEVHYTAWTFNCLENEILNNTIFTNQKIINRNAESLDSVHVGIWADFEIGCYTDDMIGCSPENNAFYAYNRDSIDGTIGNSCNLNIPTLTEDPPAQSIVFLNQEMSHFMYSANSAVALFPAINSPIQPDEFYNYLSGSFRDGTPLTYSGSGYNSSNDLTNFAFPGNPSDSLTAWTLHDFDSTSTLSSLDFHAIGSIENEIFNQGDIIDIDMAYTSHQKENFNNIENVNLMYENFPLIQQMYNEGFENHCSSDFMINTDLPYHIEFDIFPNPTNDILNIQFENKSIHQLSIFDTFGNVMFEKNRFIENELNI